MRVGDSRRQRRGGWCADCGIDTYVISEYYMVRDEVWAAARGHVCDDPCWEGTTRICRQGMLCIGCLERRLGRRLEPEDFTAAPCNDDWDRSARLRSRRGR